MAIGTTPARLLGLPGSLRAASYARAALLGLAPLLPPRASLEIRELQLPLYNQDEEGANVPASVQAFRDAVRSADGLVIATPEYNHGMPGVLKNALDWASRPYGDSALMDKPALVISVSPAFTGGVRAHAQVNETLLASGALPLGAPQVVIGGVADKIRDGRLADEASLQFALSAVERLLTLIQRHRAPLASATAG